MWFKKNRAEKYCLRAKFRPITKSYEKLDYFEGSYQQKTYQHRDSSELDFHIKSQFRVGEPGDVVKLCAALDFKTLLDDLPNRKNNLWLGCWLCLVGLGVDFRR